MNIINLKFIVVLTLVLLAIGIIGFHIFEKLDWISSFYDASAMLSLVGVGDGPFTDQGKIFAGFYTLSIGLGYIFLLGFFIYNSLEEYAKKTEQK